MYLIRGLKNINLFKERFSDFRVIATIGNFDGLHLGHQKNISDMKNIANEKKLISQLNSYEYRFHSSSSFFSSFLNIIMYWYLGIIK